MNLIVKVVLAVLGLLLLLAMAAVVFGTVTVRRPFPDVDGSVTVAGLSDEVDVYRDEFGIPHIYAQNEEDMFFAQGYVHAQDRFWQMEFWRHIGQGRLSEIIGDAGVENDKFIRTLGWNRMSAETAAYYANEAPEYPAINPNDFLH